MAGPVTFEYLGLFDRWCTDTFEATAAFIEDGGDPWAVGEIESAVLGSPLSVIPPVGARP